MSDTPDEVIEAARRIVEFYPGEGAPDATGLVTDACSVSHALLAVAERVKTLFDAIAHGDDDHKRWLKQAIEDHFDGRAVERPVGSGSAERVKVLEAALTRAAEQFEFYEREHMTKANNLTARGEVGEADKSIAKGNTNREHAQLARKALQP